MGAAVGLHWAGVELPAERQHPGGSWSSTPDTVNRTDDAALAHLPSGRFAANAAWLVLALIAFNLTRAAATLTGPTLATATTATIRQKLIAVPHGSRAPRDGSSCISPVAWPWQTAWTRLFTHGCGPPTPATT